MTESVEEIMPSMVPIGTAMEKESLRIAEDKLTVCEKELIAYNRRFQMLLSSRFSEVNDLCIAFK